MHDSLIALMWFTGTSERSPIITANLVSFVLGLAAIALRLKFAIAAHKSGTSLLSHIVWLFFCIPIVNINGIYLPIPQVLILGYSFRQLYKARTQLHPSQREKQ